MTLKGNKGAFGGTEKPEGSKFEDDRFSGMSVGKAKRKQHSDLVKQQMIQQAMVKRRQGWPLSPEEQFMLNNRELFEV